MSLEKSLSELAAGMLGLAAAIDRFTDACDAENIGLPKRPKRPEKTAAAEAGEEDPEIGLPKRPKRPEKTPEATETLPTVDEVRQALVTVADKLGPQESLRILNAAGANRIPELDAAQYASVIRRCEDAVRDQDGE